MPAKVCPRCGAQYQNLKSKTCPQCFAVLVSVDEVTAEELAAARAEVEQSPEFQQRKAEEDERFKEQSFGACLGVVAITVATFILAVVLIVVAAHRPRPAQRVGIAGSRGGGTPTTPTAEPLTTLPVAAASLDDVMPSAIGNYRRLSCDQTLTLTGTLTPLFHGLYTRPGGKPLDVYALPAARPTSEQYEFRQGLAFAGQAGGVIRPTLFFATEYWHYGVQAAPGAVTDPANFRDALAMHFRE